MVMRGVNHCIFFQSTAILYLIKSSSFTELKFTTFARNWVCICIYKLSLYLQITVCYVVADLCAKMFSRFSEPFFHYLSWGCVLWHKGRKSIHRCTFRSTADLISLPHNVAECRPDQPKQPQIITLWPEDCTVGPMHDGWIASCVSLLNLGSG